MLPTACAGTALAARPRCTRRCAPTWSHPGSEQLVHLLGQCPGDVVIGGGDTAGFVQGASGEDYTEKYDFFHISTGGGASIDYLTSETLPGITYHDAQQRPRSFAWIPALGALIGSADAKALGREMAARL